MNMKRISSMMSRKSSKSTLNETPETVSVMLLGPRGCGKTSFLYKSYFKYNDNQPDTHFDVLPTPTYNVEIIPYQTQRYQIWDFAEIGSCLNYIKGNTRVIVYMIDSIDYKNERVASKSRENMVWLLKNFEKPLENTMIITVANKQFDKTAMDIQDIGSSWVNDKELIGLLKGHDWRLFPCNALTGQGIEKVLEYVTRKLEEPIITPWDNLPNANHLDDVEFKQWFYAEKPFLFFDYYCLIRIIYLTIMNGKSTKLTHLFEILSQQVGNGYSETQTLFWIQMVSFSLLKSPLLQGEDNNFEEFFARCKLQPDCWKEYYSVKLFYSAKATKEFLPPDKKSLPNAFKSSSLALKGRHLEIDYQVL